MWVYQRHINTFSLGLIIQQTLHDQFLQMWRANLDNSSKGKNLNYIKDAVCLENFFLILPKHLYLKMVHFRTGNHKMPVETGRWQNIELDDRICDKNTLGDKFHCLMECNFLKEIGSGCSLANTTKGPIF